MQMTASNSSKIISGPLSMHFYVNKCGFHIVEFFNPFHKGPYEHMDSDEEDCGGTGMDFRFEKVVRK